MSNGSSNQVFTNTQKRITHPENGWKQIVDRTKSTEYENEQVCDSGWIHRDTNILIEKQETKQIRIYTDNRETEDMSTSNDTRQKMSAEEYNKILTTYAKATENTRVTVSDPTKHLLNLKKHYHRVIHEWEKVALCLTESWIFSLTLLIFAEYTFNKTNRNGLDRTTSTKLGNKMIMGIHLILVTLSSLVNPLIITYPLTLLLALLAHLITQDLTNHLHRNYTQKLIEHLTQRHGRPKRLHHTTKKPLLTRTPAKRKNPNLNTPNTNTRPQGNPNPQRAPPLPPDPGPQPHGAQQNPSGSNNNQKEKRKKRGITRDKKNAKLTQNKKTKTLYSSPHTSIFNCLSINIQGLSHQKWNAILGSVTVHNTAIVLTEQHLPFFDHTPSYTADSGLELHTIMGPPK